MRLPKAFRFKADEVRNRRMGDSIVLEPIDGDWDWLDAVTGPVDTDFSDAALERPRVQERTRLDDLFR